MIFLSLILPLMAFASDLRLPSAGSFVFSGEFEVQQKRVAEAVPLNNQEGQARIRELRAQGFACVSAGADWARCTGIVSPNGAESEVRERVNSLLRGVKLEFSERKGEPSLQIQGEVFEEWSVPQKVSFREKTYDGYRYQLLLDSGLHKLVFGEDGVVAEPSGFTYVASLQRQPSRNLVISYIIGARLR